MNGEKCKRRVGSESSTGHANPGRLNPAHSRVEESRLYRYESAAGSCFLAWLTVRPIPPRTDSQPSGSWRSSDRGPSLRSVSARPEHRLAQVKEYPVAARRGTTLQSPLRLHRSRAKPRAREAAFLRDRPGFPRRKLFPPTSVRRRLFGGRIRTPGCPPLSALRSAFQRRLKSRPDSNGILRRLRGARGDTVHVVHQTRRVPARRCASGILNRVS